MKNVHKMSIEEYSRLHEPDRNTEHDPNFYNESYQIEIDDIDDDAMEDIGIDHDPLIHETSKDSVFDPLADIEIGNVVSGENLDFSFEDEESMASAEDYIEGFGHPRILETKPDVNNIANNDDTEAGTLDKPSINTQTIKNIVSKTLFQSASKSGNCLNNNSESMESTSQMNSSQPFDHSKESITEGNSEDHTTEADKEQDNELFSAANESQSIISLQMLNRNNESFNNDPETSQGKPDNLTEDITDKQEGYGPTYVNNSIETTEHPSNIEPILAHDQVLTDQPAEVSNSMDDFPEIDFSSVNMGVLELDNMEGNPLG